jgi:hypothetical protein
MVATLIKKLKLFLLPKKRRIYVVLEGRYKGEWLVQVNKNVFFSLPDKHVRNISLIDFEWGLLNKVLKPVDVLPKGVYNICIAEYNLKATDARQNYTFNRRKQHPTPDPLGSE